MVGMGTGDKIVIVMRMIFIGSVVRSREKLKEGRTPRRRRRVRFGILLRRLSLEIRHFHNDSLMQRTLPLAPTPTFQFNIPVSKARTLPSAAAAIAVVFVLEIRTVGRLDRETPKTELCQAGGVLQAYPEENSAKRPFRRTG